MTSTENQSKSTQTLIIEKRIYFALLIGFASVVFYPEYALAAFTGSIIRAIITTACCLGSLLAIDWFWKPSTNQQTTSDSMSVFQFVHDLTLHTNGYPELIAICSCMCLLSTVAPINIYFSYNLMQALSGSTTSAFLQAAHYSLIYINCRFDIHRILMKIWSQVFGGNQGGDIIRLRQRQILVAEENAANQSENAANQSEIELIKNPQNNSPFQDASKLTSNVWYFVQTCAQAFIAMVASLNAVLNFPLPASFQLAKKLVLIRTTATACCFTMLTTIASAWSERAQKENNDIRYETGKELSKTSDRAFSDKYIHAQKNQSIFDTIQGAFFDLADNLKDDNLITLLIVIITLNPAFPLGAQISLAQVTALASVLTGMTMACLAISRNMGALSSANALFNKFMEIFRFGDNTYAIENTPRADVKSHLQREFRETLATNTQKSFWYNALDSIAVIPLAVYIVEQFVSTGLGINPMMLAAGAAISGWHFFSTMIVSNQHATEKANEKNTDSSSIHSIRQRCNIMLCNLSTSALFVRLSTMFVPTTWLQSSLCMLAGGGFAAQIACLGLASHFAITLFATPRMMLWGLYRAKSAPGAAATARSIIADEIKPIVTGIEQLHKLSSTVCNQIFNTQSLGKLVQPPMIT
ncbi:MAG: hypothetical protein CMF43_04490 [Legionellales bacterium]|nr:hypothetical protein [Legionellales bacterium]